jgi:hypothetical protein
VHLMMVLGWLSSHSREGPALAEFIYIPSRLIYERCCIVTVWRESQVSPRWNCSLEIETVNQGERFSQC